MAGESKKNKSSKKDNQPQDKDKKIESSNSLTSSSLNNNLLSPNETDDLEMLITSICEKNDYLDTGVLKKEYLDRLRKLDEVGLIIFISFSFVLNEVLGKYGLHV